MGMMPPNNSEIIGNTVGPHGEQNNVIQNSVNYNHVNNNTQHIFNVHLPNTLPPSRRIIEDFHKDHATPQLDRIWGTEVIHRYLEGEYQDQSARDAQRQLSAKAPYCFVKNAIFPESDTFDRNLSKHLARYPNTRTTRCIIEILKPPQLEALSQWTNSRESKALLLDLPPGSREKSWTTHFTLEIICRIKGSKQPNGGSKATGVVAHFCNSSEPWTEQIVIRDFLAQLRKARGDVLKKQHICGRDDNIYHDDTRTPNGLWGLLLHSVVRAEIQSLYVIIDNFDAILGQAGNSGLQEFWDHIRQFSQASQTKGVPVKLLVTSRSPKTIDHFSNLCKIRLSQDPRERFKC